jgi:hypothetical protein
MNERTLLQERLQVMWTKSSIRTPSLILACNIDFGHFLGIKELHIGYDDGLPRWFPAADRNFFASIKVNL